VRPYKTFGTTLSRLGRISLAIGVVGLSLMGFQNDAQAFCVSNDSLSRSTLDVQQLRQDQYEAMEGFLRCMNFHRGADRDKRCSPHLRGKEPHFLDSDKRFAKEIGPNQTFCCNYKNKDCNPSRKKSGKVYFFTKVHNSINNAPWFKTGYGTFKLLHAGKATDHLVCKTFRVKDHRNKSFEQIKKEADTQAPDCKVYAYPNTPPWPNEKTLRNVMIKSAHTGKCLDIAGGSKKNGANVIMWKCHGKKNQRWTVSKDGLIRSALNGKCLDLAVRKGVKNAKNGTNVNMYDCHRGKNQVWKYIKRTRELQVILGKRPCLEVGGWNKKNGANANVWQCSRKGQANQQWVLAK
jgi:hypothetical protein